MSGRIDFGGIERHLGEIVRKLDKPFQDIHERQRHDENIKKQNELLEKQISLVNWTRILAIFTIFMAIGTIIMAIGTIYMAYVQTPMPKMLLNAPEFVGLNCSGFNNTAFHLGAHVKVANVGTRTSFNTKLIVTAEEPISFYGAAFVKFGRTVNQTNPNIYTGHYLPLEGIKIGDAYWIVDKQKISIFLNEIDPGENLELMVEFNRQCGLTKNVNFKVTEEGFGVQSDIKTTKMFWLN